MQQLSWNTCFCGKRRAKSMQLPQNWRISVLSTTIPFTVKSGKHLPSVTCKSEIEFNYLPNSPSSTFANPQRNHLVLVSPLAAKIPPFSLGKIEALSTRPSNLANTKGHSVSKKSLRNLTLTTLGLLPAHVIRKVLTSLPISVNPRSQSRQLTFLADLTSNLLRSISRITYTVVRSLACYPLSTNRHP
jgi:hypothetical protein